MAVPLHDTANQPNSIELLGRQFVGIERDHEWFKVASDRIKRVHQLKPATYQPGRLWQSRVKSGKNPPKKR